MGGGTYRWSQEEGEARVHFTQFILGTLIISAVSIELGPLLKLCGRTDKRFCGTNQGYIFYGYWKYFCYYGYGWYLLFKLLLWVCFRVRKFIYIWLELAFVSKYYFIKYEKLI